MERSCIALITCLVMPTLQAGAQSISLNPAVTHQTITGWEATSQSGFHSQAFAPTFELYKNQLYDLAINDLGINRLRLEIRDTVETTNDDANAFNINLAGFDFTKGINPGGFDGRIDQTIVPMHNLMAAQGRHLWVNVCYVPGGGFTHTSADEYAEFVLATYQHMDQKYGFVPDSWEVILEPDTFSGWNSTSPPRIGQAIVAAGARLAAAGYTPRFIGPSVSHPSNTTTYMDALLAVPGVTPYLEELSFHRYGTITDAELQTIAAKAAAAGVNTSMLEKLAVTYVELHKDLKYGNVSAWQQYTLAFPAATDDGNQYYFINDDDLANPKLVLSARAKFLRQYFRYIHEGAVRIDANSIDAKFDPVAFINEDGSYVAVVTATGAGTFTLDGLPAGTFGIRYTTSSAFDIGLPNAILAEGGLLSASIPAAGVITVFQIVPEPSSLALLGAGTLALLRRRGVRVHS